MSFQDPNSPCFAGTAPATTSSLRCELLSSIVEKIGPVFWALDFDPPRLAYVSPTVEDVWGFDRSEVVDWRSSWMDVVAEPDRARARVAADAMLVTGEMNVDFRVVLSDGNTRWLNVRSVPIHDDEGCLVRAVGVTENIDERKESETRMNQLAAIVTAAQTAILSVGLDGRLRSVNPEAERMFGYRADEVLGRSILELAPDGHEDSHEEIMDAFTRGERVGHREIVAKRKDGSLLDVSVTGFSLIDPDGEVYGAAAILRDVTEQKRAERRLSEAEERYRAVMEASPFGLCVLDLKTLDVVFANSSFCRMSDRECGELMGYPITDCFPERQRERMAVELDAMARGDKTKLASVPFMQRDESIVYADAAASPATLEGRRCVILFFTEVSRSIRTGTMKYGDLEIDTDAHAVRIKGEPVELGAKEFELLTFLASSPKRAFTRSQLLENVWLSSEEWQSPHTVTEHVRLVRGKIEQDRRRPRRIVTVRGVGYRFEP